MQQPSRDPIHLFDSSIPPHIQADLFVTIKKTYPASFRATSDLAQEPEIHDLYPHVRRGQIEGAARFVAERHGLTAEVKTNRSGNSHTVIQGGNFFLTISQVSDPSDNVRHTAFREEDALNNYPLFERIPDEEPPPSGTRFNAILKHGPNLKNPRELGYAMIVFPNPDGRSCLDININFMERYKGAESEAETFREETIPDALDDLGIRTDLPNQNEGGA